MKSEGDVVTLERDGHRISIAAAGHELAAAVKELSAGGVTLARLTGDPVRLPMVMRRLARGGWLRYSIMDGAVVATPVATPETEWPALDPDARYALSRFAYLHRDGDTLLLRSPLSYLEVAVADPRAIALVARLAAPRPYDELVETDLDAQVMRLFRHARLVCEPDGEDGEDGDPAIRQWEFHDLLFHASTRDGRHDRPTGGTYRFRGEIDPLPAVRPAIGELVTLPAPRAERPETSLFDVLDRRRSIRRHGERPLTKEELGEFLHRSARLSGVFRAGDEEVGRRPYPGGGGLHELEIYVVAGKCADLPAGLYHYRAREHALGRVSEMTAPVEALLRDAAFSTANPEGPQVLIVIAARFQRLSWKYQRIAYSLILKHVGCLIQTMYLVATALELAPCAIGGGNSELFTRALGESYFTETSVGEFALGTRPDRDAEE
ncbi:SagB family peptide dehydrogenase [Planobispora rosea]|nr:SagB family peptide dehydrogenase [Planobispora rosea]